MANRISPEPVRVSTNVTRPRTAPRASFGTALAGGPDAGHRQKPLRCEGLSAGGAGEAVNGTPISNDVDRAVVRAALQRSSDSPATQMLMSQYTRAD
jgi:hypothetical protein